MTHFCSEMYIFQQQKKKKIVNDRSHLGSLDMTLVSIRSNADYSAQIIRF